MYDAHFEHQSFNKNCAVCIGSVIINWVFNFCRNLALKIDISSKTALCLMKKTPTTVPPTSPLKVQQVYIKKIFIKTE